VRGVKELEPSFSTVQQLCFDWSVAMSHPFDPPLARAKALSKRLEQHPAMLERIESILDLGESQKGA